MALDEPRRPRRCTLERLMAAWNKTRVELHGQYSLQRLTNLHAHTRDCTARRRILIIFLTPLPAIGVVAALDWFKLDAPEKGALSSANFCIRLCCYAAATAFVELTQAHAAIPALLLGPREFIAISLACVSGALGVGIGLSLLIGFPVPFTLPMVSPAMFAAFVGAFWYYCRHVIRSSAEVKKLVQSQLVILTHQTNVAMLYPMYAYAFTLLSSYAQTAFVLLLPCMKIALNILISRGLGDQDDVKPETVNFNTEIFHALYVSLCMGNSTSYSTTTALIAVDIVHAWLSLHDLKDVVRDLNALLDKMPVVEETPVGDMSASTAVTTRSSGPTLRRRRRHDNIIDAAIEILECDHLISRPSASSDAGVSAFRALAMRRKLDQTGRAYDVSGVLGLTAAERVQFVQNATKALFMTECFVLVEYIEVVVPVVYCASTLLMFYLPNRAYYPHLAHLTQEELLGNVTQVLLYAALELLSFLAMGVAIKRQLGVAWMHQLAMVLTRQWRQVQCKLAFWVMYVAQMYLVHFGVDFSFKFKWLSKALSPSP
ncbi:hypothetical protein PybrP1_011270 [[Pythium] brassicae (nom. inval.)]|nr:hypothetical protein PybrP1_011270 [[Pythium] brassicae (nom. inval.)]